MTKLLFVCHGNICRSPMAEFVMKRLVDTAGLSKRFDIESAATSTEELGNPVHPGTQKKLREHGVSCAGKTARRLRREDYERFDWLIAMDDNNLRHMHAMLGGDPQGKITKLLAFCGEGRDIDDPWYTHDFERTYRDVLRGCEAVLRFCCGERQGE